MQRFIVFESEEGKERFRFEVTDSTWILLIDEIINRNTSQEVLKKIIEESSDEALFEAAISYYRGRLSFKELCTFLEKFEKEGKDVTCGVIEHCVVNRRKLLLKKFVDFPRERVSKLAREAIIYS